MRFTLFHCNDTSLSGAGLIWSTLDGGAEVIQGVSAVDFTMLGFGTDSSFQNLSEYMGAILAVIGVSQGCIPVTFDALTASSMYTWHWEEEFWKAVSIECPFDPTAKRYFDPVLAVQSLLLHNATLIAEKQELIRLKFI